MPDLLQSAAVWLAGQLKTPASPSVTYRRGAASVVLAATIGETRSEQTTTDGLTTDVLVRDYLIAAAELILDGERTLPERGDTIEETVGAQTLVFEVVPLAGQAHWRWCDAAHVMLRIHTQQIDTLDS
jgi:hypothetical protein